jgi:hypothetical protein
MLPAQDAECTFAVSVVAAPPPGQPEQVKVSYYTPEEALRNVLENTAYDKLFREKKAEKDEILHTFAADRAIEFIRECADKHKVGEEQLKAAQLMDFLKCYRECRDRLGKLHIDSIDHLDTYVRKTDEEHIGHLLLVKLVEIYRNNQVLQQNGFQIADTPGVDSLNQAARDITFNYMREADAVVYFAQARGLSVEFEKVREHMSKFHNDVREKMFVVANQADWYDVKSMQRDRGEKPQIEVIFENIVAQLAVLGVNEKRLHFTCGRIAELAEKRSGGSLAPAETTVYSELRAKLDERLSKLDRGVNPTLYSQLNACFSDGGVDHFRTALINYLQYDIQVERLKEVFIDLEKAYQAIHRLLDPEQARIKSIVDEMGPISQQITKFFTETKEKFLDKVSVLDVNAQRAMTALMAKAREQVEKMIDSAVERLNIGRVKMKVSPPTPINIKTEVINFFKSDLSERFVKVVQDTISPVFRAKLMEQVAESSVSPILVELAKGWGADFDKQFDRLMDNFGIGLDHFTVMRAREETWSLLAANMHPAKAEMEWSEKVEAEFRNDLKKVFKARFVDYCTKLEPTLARHYQCLLQDLFKDLEKLLDAVSEAIKKDPTRIVLPANLLGGKGDSDEERRRMSLMSYFKQYETIRQQRDRVAPNFSNGSK